MILQDALHSALPTIQSDLSAPELNPTQKYNILINFIKSKIPLKKDKSPSKHNPLQQATPQTLQPSSLVERPLRGSSPKQKTSHVFIQKRPFFKKLYKF